MRVASPLIIIFVPGTRKQLFLCRKTQRRSIGQRKLAGHCPNIVILHCIALHYWPITKRSESLANCYFFSGHQIVSHCGFTPGFLSLINMSFLYNHCYIILNLFVIAVQKSTRSSPRHKETQDEMFVNSNKEFGQQSN